MPGGADCLTILQCRSDSTEQCLRHRAACSSLLCWTAKAAGASSKQDVFVLLKTLLPNSKFRRMAAKRSKTQKETRKC